MNVIVDPNIKKVSERINPNGDIINPRTKEIISANIPDYVPTAEEIAKQVAPQQTAPTQDKIGALIEAKIAEKIDAIVAKRIDDILSKL